MNVTKVDLVVGTYCLSGKLDLKLMSKPYRLVLITLFIVANKIYQQIILKVHLSKTSLVFLALS